MASKDRLDDQPRMMKVKRNGLNKFEIGLFSVNERERMLGFPEGYVKSAGKTGHISTQELPKKFMLTIVIPQLTTYTMSCIGMDTKNKQRSERLGGIPLTKSFIVSLVTLPAL